MSTPDLQAAKDELTAKLDAERAELDKWNKRVMITYNKLENVNAELDQRYLLSHSESDWPFLLEEVGNTSMTRYKAAQNAFAKIVPTTGSTGITPIGFSGYLPSIQQRSIQISMINGDHQLTVAAVKALEEQLLPHVKKVEDDEIGPHKRLGIFEASLAEHGVYWIAIDEDRNMYDVYLTRYHTTHLHHKAKTLLDLLTYVEEHLPYKRVHDGDDDE